MRKCTCPHCGDNFETTVRTKKYCTKECKELAKAERLAARKKAKQTYCENCQGPKGTAKGRYCTQPECRRLSVRSSYETRSEFQKDVERQREKSRRREPKPRVQGPLPACRNCSKTLSRLNQRFCNAVECKNAYHAEWRAKNKDSVKRTRGAMKAKRRHAYVEHVDVKEIYRRDGWVCGICREKVSEKLTYPHPRSASLDHVIPLSLGGKHENRNCQLAHLQCNVKKGNRKAGDQLALI